jgi:hypothetical protein
LAQLINFNGEGLAYSLKSLKIETNKEQSDVEEKQLCVKNFQVFQTPIETLQHIALYIF